MQRIVMVVYVCVWPSMCDGVDVVFCVVNVVLDVVMVVICCCGDGVIYGEILVALGCVGRLLWWLLLSWLLLLW